MASAQQPAGAALAHDLFRVLSRERRRRFLHPEGVAYRCRVDLEQSPFGAPGRHDGVARFSRAFGVPRPWPDVLGLAFRIEDAHGDGRPQDLLLASALNPYLPAPATSFFGPAFSSLLPYGVGGGRRLVVAQASGAAPRGPLDPLAELDAAAGRARFTLRLEPFGRPLGSLTVEERLPQPETERLRFDPATTGPELAWWPNRIRPPAYRGSQAGRPS